MTTTPALGEIALVRADISHIEIHARRTGTGSVLIERFGIQLQVAARNRAAAIADILGVPFVDEIR